MTYTIAIDFDGTIVKHGSGDPVPGAFEWMKKFQAAGARLVLWTMRYEKGGWIDSLPDAIKLCLQHGVRFDDHNPKQMPGRSSKARAQCYIDDLAFGCPLRYDKKHVRPYVDWRKVGPGVMKLMEAHNARYNIQKPKRRKTRSYLDEEADVNWFGGGNLWMPATTRTSPSKGR